MAVVLSPNMQIIRSYVVAKYADQITHIGVYNCRRIAGSQSYSQHSWPNAIDIHVTDEFRANAIEKANGDAIFADLLRTFGDHLYEKIWWTTNHWNHIHVSTYPRGWLLPPCAGGEFKIRHKDGTTEVVSEFPNTIEEEDIVATLDEVRAVVREELARVVDPGSPDSNSPLQLAVHGILVGRSGVTAAAHWQQTLALVKALAGKTLTDEEIDRVVAEIAESFGISERD